MNKQKLLELADFIEKSDPRKFDMSDWIRFADEEVCLDKFEESCQTSCCIAGYVVLREGLCLRGSSVYDKDGDYQGYAENVASRILGLSEIERHPLFFACEWPSDFYLRYADGKKEDRPKLAAEVIRHFVANNGWVTIPKE